MGKFAFIFPGQGAQCSGMGLDLYESYGVSKYVFDIADETLGRKISKICFEGNDEELKQTKNSQSAILAVEIAILKTFLEKTDIMPSFVAGHSLGEYAALYAAGAIDIGNIFPVIQKRADLMHDASLLNKGGMAAVLGLGSDVIKENLIESVWVANYNEPNQTVITGVEDSVLKNCEILKEKGARRVVPLAVSGAFHSPLMKDAAEKFQEYVLNLHIVDSIIPVVTNLDGEITVDSEEIREKMPRQITSSVQWVKTIQKMIENGVDKFIEMGPGKVLSGLNRKMCGEGIKTYSISDVKSLEETLKELEKVSV